VHVQRRERERAFLLTSSTDPQPFSGVASFLNHNARPLKKSSSVRHFWPRYGSKTRCSKLSERIPFGPWYDWCRKSVNAFMIPGMSSKRWDRRRMSCRTEEQSAAQAWLNRGYAPRAGERLGCQKTPQHTLGAS